MFKNTYQKIIAAVVGVIIFLFMLSVVIATLLYNFIMGGSVGVTHYGNPTSMEKTVAPTPTISVEAPNEILKFRGVVKSDPAYAKENDLPGDWYWLVFDEPYLLKENATGIPMYMNELQIYPIEKGVNIMNKTLSDFEGTHVEVAGHLGWGYAESKIIEPVAITSLE
jgi:hypothetical protein